MSYIGSVLGDTLVVVNESDLYWSTSHIDSGLRVTLVVAYESHWLWCMSLTLVVIYQPHS